MKKPPVPPYRVPEVCRLTGISYRQLDYWDRIGLVRPSVRAAAGSGSQRLYSESNVAELRLIHGLLEAGVSLQRIRRDGDPIITAARLVQALDRLLDPEKVSA